MVFGISKSSVLAFSVGSIGALVVQAIYEKYMQTFWRSSMTASSGQLGKQLKDISAQTDNAMTDNSTQTATEVTSASVEVGATFSGTKESGVQCGPCFEEARHVAIQASSDKPITVALDDNVDLVDQKCGAFDCDAAIDDKKCVSDPEKATVIEDDVEGSGQKSAVQVQIGENVVFL